MMFAQANSEHCRHKIFNARLDDRRRGAGHLAVPDDPQHREAESRRARSSRTRTTRRSWRAASRNAGSRAARATRRALRAQRRTDAHADEGRDAQPPDRDLAVPGRLDRRGRRNPRRRRDRPRRAAEGRSDGLHGVESGLAGRAPEVGKRPRQRDAGSAAQSRRQRRTVWQAGPHRVAVADHDRRPARRRGIQQRVRPAEPRRLFPRLRAERRGARARLSQADHDRGRHRQYLRPAHAQDRVAGRHAADPARRPGHAHRHGRRRGKLDGDRRQHRRARLRFGAARQSGNPAPRAGSHQRVLAARRGEPDPGDPRRRRGRHCRTRSRSSSTARARARASTCARCRSKRAAWRRSEIWCNESQERYVLAIAPGRSAARSKRSASASAARSRWSAWRPKSAS